MSTYPANASTGRQHGPMEYSTAPTDLDAVRRYRLARVREQLRKHDYAAIVLYDQINTRYATDATNMQLWCLHNEIRYVFVPAEGPVVQFEHAKGFHLLEDLPTVDEVRPATTFLYLSKGPNHLDFARKWAAEIADLVRQHGAGNRRIAIDRVAPEGVLELTRLGLQVCDGFEVMEQARAIKSPGEIALMRAAVEVCERGIGAMYEAMEPGITENALWSKLHATNIEFGGEWIETRLLSSGPRTNPWFRECSLRPIEQGDIVTFDTDLIGPYGYCVDMSRAWVCGAAPSDEQRRLHEAAVSQLRHNSDLIRPGAGFREVTEKSWPIPDEFVASRYGCLAHGVGLADEFPVLFYAQDYDRSGYDGVIEPGMVLSVESYIGSKDGREGIKLEEQLLVTDDGVEQLTGFPLELRIP